MNFAALEARVNSATLRALSNVTASIGGADPVTAIFDEAYAVAEVGVGVASTAPALTLATASVPAEPDGAPVLVRGTAYTVVAHQPDGTGMSVLLLERA